MESKIELLVRESISIAEKKFEEDNTTKLFEESKDKFKELIVKGFIKERGNNLLSLSDKKSNSSIIFNTK